MANRQKPFGGAPPLGTGLAPGEPELPTTAQDVQGFGGAPTLQTHINRAGKAVAAPSGPVAPDVYGSAPSIAGDRVTPKKATGGSAGPGATTGVDI